MFVDWSWSMRGGQGKGQPVAGGYKGRVATCRDEKGAGRSGWGKECEDELWGCEV